MKRVLITGSSGQLGRFLSKFLENKLIVQRTCRSICNFDFNACYELDVTNADVVEKVISRLKPDVIINLAAITNVDFCESNKLEARSVNVFGLENLIKFSSVNTKIIHISSDYVFDGSNCPYSEEDSPNPINYYGKTKLESENLLRGSRRDSLIIRVSGIYSHYIDLKSNFVGWLYNSLKSRKSINIFNDQYTPPACVMGLSKFIFQSIILDISGIIHYGSSNSISRYDFSIEFCKEFGFRDNYISPASINSFNFDAERPLNSSLNIDRLRTFKSTEIFTTRYSLSKIKAHISQ